MRFLTAIPFSPGSAMALTLQQGQPVDPRSIVRMSGLGPAGTNIDTFARRYPHLLAWRDALYARHRWPDEAASGPIARSDARQT